MEIVAVEELDLVIMDVHGGRGGMALLQTLKDSPACVSCSLRSRSTRKTIEAMRLGIHGIALKERDPEEILTTIQEVRSGRTRFDRAVTEGALRYSVNKPTPRTKQDALLTARENMIVDHVVQGRRNREIADQMNLTEGTVKVHIHNVFRKLGVTSRTELIVKRGNPKYF